MGLTLRRAREREREREGKGTEVKGNMQVHPRSQTANQPIRRPIAMSLINGETLESRVEGNPLFTVQNTTTAKINQQAKTVEIPAAVKS